MNRGQPSALQIEEDHTRQEMQTADEGDSCLPKDLQLDSKLGALTMHQTRVERREIADRLREAFDDNPMLPGVMLTDQNRFYGLISRRQFQAQLSRPFGIELFLNRPIDEMDHDLATTTMVLSCHVSIVDAARNAVERPVIVHQDPIIVHFGEEDYRLLDVHHLLLAQSRIQRLAINLYRETNQKWEEAAKELKATQQQLIDTAHQAGRAEIAADVIHNIGNALNSVDTGLVMMLQHVSNIRLDFLERLVDLLQDERAPVHQLLAQDDKGKHVAPALVKFSKTLSRQHGLALDEGAKLRRQLEVLNSVLKAQESQTKPKEIFEKINLGELFEQIVQSQIPKPLRYHVDITFDIAIDTLVTLAKTKLGQVLRHLILNACESVQDNTDAKEIQIRATHHEGRVLRIEVVDNGRGVDTEDHVRIFSYGYSTKDYGNGYGLHYCANAVKEMGGHIGVQSKGVGSGATFFVDLPLNQPMMAGEG